MSRCVYNSKRLIPCPFVEFSKTYQSTDDGTKIGSLWNITIAGKMLTDMGSPDSSGTFWTVGGFPPNESISENLRLGSLFRKQEALRELFAEDGHVLEWQSEDASSAPISCNPRIKEIQFSRDLWYNFVEYSINAEADVLYINGQAYGEDTWTTYVDSASESWQIETDESQPVSESIQRIYRVSHTVTAKGKRFFDAAGILTMDAWKQAKEWVSARLGFDSSILSASLVYDAVGNTPYNYIRSETIDEVGGSYTVTESWVLAGDSATESFDVSVKTSVSTGLTSVTIDGSITGLEVRDSSLALTTSKYTNATTKFTSINPLTRAQAYSGLTLNITPLNTMVGKNPVAGTISYSYEYDTRPSNLISSAKSETISINDSLGTDVVAIIPVLARVKGPILQDMQTSKERRRTIDVEAVFPVTYTTPSINPPTSYVSEVTTVIESADPLVNNMATKSFVDDNTVRWEPKEGRLSMTRTWIYE